MADSVSTRQFALWLSPVQVAALHEEVLVAIRPRLGNGPSPDRAKYLLTSIFFPVQEPPGPARPRPSP